MRLGLVGVQAGLLVGWLVAAARWDDCWSTCEEGQSDTGWPYLVVIALALVSAFVTYDFPFRRRRLVFAPIAVWLAVAAPLAFVVTD